MIQLMTFVVLGTGFYGGSVSFAERVEALWQNPAGLSLHSDGLELQTRFEMIGNEPYYRIGYSAFGLGLSFRNGDSASIWTAGLGIPIGRKFRLGGAYTWGEEKFWNFGIQANPWNWLALGAAVKTGEIPEITGGFGVRPFTDRITLFSDLTYAGGFDNLRAGLAVEPLPGILLTGSVIQPLDGGGGLSFVPGLELAFGNFKLLGAYYGMNPNREPEFGVDIGLSFPRYPSIKFKKPGPKVVKWVPKGRGEEPQPSGFKIGSVSFGKSKSKTFYDLLTEIRALGESKDIKGILLDFRGAGYSFYQAEEIRAELVKIKEKGKKIIAFSEGYGMGTYYLASVADRIYMVPTGEISLLGGYARSMHLKGALDKLGIEPEFYRVGEYKSAYELFEFAETSDEDKEQLAAYLTSRLNQILSDIENDRGVPRNEFEKMMNEKVLVSGDDAVELGLVDSLCLALDLDSIMELEFGKKVTKISMSDVTKKPDEIPRAWLPDEEEVNIFKKGKIAVVVAEGSIVTGKSFSSPLPIPLLGGKNMGSTTISQILEKIKNDDNIKAVVFRINSGGGSALASEIMNRALTDLANEKPVVVSMAGSAASGGYYIAAPADKIFADVSTVTGSIGILGGKFVTKGLNDKLGINYETIKIYPHSDMFSPDRPFDAEEALIAQHMMDQGYAEFVNRVAEGRDMTFEEVDKIARGRIWSGPDGVRVGLVDEIGGILDAVEEARKMADLDENCRVVMYPKAKAQFDLDEGFGMSSLINLDMLEPWLSENLFYMVPFQIEIPVD